MSQKLMQLESPKPNLAQKCATMSPGNSFIACVGLWILVSAGF